MTFEEYYKTCSCPDYAKAWYQNDLNKKKFWDEHRNTCDGCQYCINRDVYGYHPNDGMSVLDPRQRLKHDLDRDFLLLINENGYKEPPTFCPVCFGFPCVLKGEPAGLFISGAHVARRELDPDVNKMMYDIIGGLTKILSWLRRPAQAEELETSPEFGIKK